MLAREGVPMLSLGLSPLHGLEEGGPGPFRACPRVRAGEAACLSGGEGRVPSGHVQG